MWALYVVSWLKSAPEAAVRRHLLAALEVAQLNYPVPEDMADWIEELASSVDSDAPTPF